MTVVSKTITIEELEKLVGQVGRKLPVLAKTAMQASMWAMVRDAVVNRMSGQYLGIVTGKGRQSVDASGQVTASGNRIAASLGSPFGYIRAHEEGYVGPAKVPAHTVRGHRIRAHSRRAHTRRDGVKVKAHNVRAHKIGPRSVRAHTRQLNIRARRFLRDTLRQEAGDIPALLGGGDTAPVARRLIRAMRIYVEGGRMPKAAELRA